MRLLLILAAVAFATASFNADAQQRYRWVDDDGGIRISDRIPPGATDKRIEVLNARGMVVRVIEPKRELMPKRSRRRPRSAKRPRSRSATRSSRRGATACCSTPTPRSTT